MERHQLQTLVPLIPCESHVASHLCEIEGSENAQYRREMLHLFYRHLRLCMKIIV